MNEQSEALENLLKARRDYLAAMGIPDWSAPTVRVMGTSAIIELNSLDLENADYKPKGYINDPDAPLARLAYKKDPRKS